MNAFFLKVVLLLACLSAAGIPLEAQVPAEPDPISSARVRVGPVGLTPSLALTNVGVDSNVFNEVENPQRDFTLTLSPQLQSWMRAGRSRLASTTSLGLVYFRRFASERSVDGSVRGEWRYRLNRLIPWARGLYSNGRQRAGYEVDLRTRRVTTDAVVGADLAIGGRTRLTVDGRRLTYRHDADALFLGSSLQQTLTYASKSGGLSYRYALTPLTTLVVDSRVVRDRFPYLPARNANSAQAMAGFDLEARALISGQVRVGFRKFTPLGGALLPFRGAVANVEAATVLGGRARVELVGQRDVNYSFELTYPYYVLTGATLTITPRLTDHWDVQARGGAQRLAYERLAGSDGPVTRLDRFGSWGGGVGYRLGRSVRLGFNVDRERRRSPLQTRDYTGLRFGSSVIYGQ